MLPEPVGASLRRIAAIAGQTALIRRRDPGQLISYIVMPMVLMVVLKPLYERAVSGGRIQVVSPPDGGTTLLVLIPSPPEDGSSGPAGGGAVEE